MSEKVELAKLKFEHDKFRQSMLIKRWEIVGTLIVHAMKSGTYLGGIYFIFAGLGVLLNERSPEAIKAIAEVVKATDLGSILGYVWGGAMTTMYGFERRGKKRAIREKSKYQKEVEAGEPNRTSSGLTPTGETPS